jgi:hypothetical protein
MGISMYLRPGALSRLLRPMPAQPAIETKPPTIAP